MPCRNISDKPRDTFLIHPEDYAAAEDQGEVIKIVHSHPRSSPQPSQPDLTQIEQTGLPWIIVHPATGQMTETKPSGYIAPLIGREYSFGVLDCLTLIRDYYLQELNIKIPDASRENYWNGENGMRILAEYAAYGFQKVDDLKKHDVIVMYAGGKEPSHLGIYLGDGDFLHHNTGRFSSRDVYGNAGYWYKNTWGYLRHIDLI